MLLGIILIICGTGLLTIVLTKSKEIEFWLYSIGSVLSVIAIILGGCLCKVDNSKSAIIKYLNGEVKVDTLAINPKTKEIIEIKVEFND